jgi:hypothetical protein
MPLFFKASISRLAAMAAPPYRSDVFTSNTFISRKVLAKVLLLSVTVYIFSVFLAVCGRKGVSLHQ